MEEIQIPTKITTSLSLSLPLSVNGARPIVRAFISPLNGPKLDDLENTIPKFGIVTFYQLATARNYFPPKCPIREGEEPLYRHA